MICDILIRKIKESYEVEDMLSKFDRAWVEIEMHGKTEDELKRILLSRVNLLDWPKPLVRGCGLYSEYQKLREENTRLNRNARPEDRVKPVFRMKRTKVQCCSSPDPFTSLQGSVFETICANCSVVLKTPPPPKKISLRDTLEQEVNQSDQLPKSKPFSRWKDFSMFILKFQGLSLVKA